MYLHDNLTKEHSKEYSDKRVDWIDMAKGFTMILVMLGHAPFPHAFKVEIYTFHIPLFFVLSGYLFSFSKYNNLQILLKRKFKSLIIPYLSFSFINYFFWVIIFRELNGQQDISLFKPLLGTFLAERGREWSPHNGTMWFVACLFVSEIVFFLIVKSSKINYKKILTCLIISSVLGYCYSIITVKSLPWNVDASLTAIVFYGLGHYMKRMESNLAGYIKVKYVFVFLIINVLSGFLNYKSSTQIIDIFSNQYGNYFLFYLSSISGIIAVFIFIRLLPKINILTYIGRNSIVFLAFHQFILFRSISKLLEKINIYDSGNMFVLTLQGIFYTLVSSVVLIPIIYVINNYFPFILGKRKLILQSVT